MGVSNLSKAFIGAALAAVLATDSAAAAAVGVNRGGVVSLTCDGAARRACGGMMPGAPPAVLGHDTLSSIHDERPDSASAVLASVTHGLDALTIASFRVDGRTQDRADMGDAASFVSLALWMTRRVVRELVPLQNPTDDALGSPMPNASSRD